MKKKSLTLLGEGKFIRLVRRIDGWEYAERINNYGAAVIVALTDDKKVLFIEQFRPPINKNVIELPAGLADDCVNAMDVDLKKVAERELYEETGYKSQEMKYLTHGPSSPGLSNEQYTLFIAKGLEKKGSGGGIDDEKIFVHEIPFDDAEGWLAKQQAKGLSIDPKVYIGLYFLRDEFN